MNLFPKPDTSDGPDRTRLYLIAGTVVAVIVAASALFFTRSSDELPPLSTIGLGATRPPVATSTSSAPAASSSPTPAGGGLPTIKRDPFGALVRSTPSSTPVKAVPTATGPAAQPTANPAPTPSTTTSTVPQRLEFGVKDVAADNKSSTVTLNGEPYSAKLFAVVENVVMAVEYTGGECGRYFVGNLDSTVQVCEGEVKQYVVTG